MKTTYDEAVAHAKTLNSDFVWVVTKDYTAFATVPDDKFDDLFLNGWQICGSVKREFTVLTMFGGVEL